MRRGVFYEVCWMAKNQLAIRLGLNANEFTHQLNRVKNSSTPFLAKMPSTAPRFYGAS